jgi:hypothetical protein
LAAERRSQQGLERFPFSVLPNRRTNRHPV